MVICPSCGAPKAKTTTRDGLVVHNDPPRVNYRGRRLDLTRKQAQMMEKLVRFHEAPFEMLEAEGDRGKGSRDPLFLAQRALRHQCISVNPPRPLRPLREA